MNIEQIKLVLANWNNYRHERRPLSDIKYICIHYTGNVNDTAANNCAYFAREVLGNASAHYFVSDFTVLQSVPLDHYAFSVGDKTNVNKASMHGIITNANSVSIELCGSKTSTEASGYTKETGAELTASLLIYLGLKPDRVFRHYDVSGKVCPAWAVQEPQKWFDFLTLVYSYYNKMKEGGEMFTDAEYNKFCSMMTKYTQEQAEQAATYGETDAELCAKYKVINDGRPQSWTTRRELQTVTARLLRLMGKT